MFVAALGICLQAGCSTTIPVSRPVPLYPPAYLMVEPKPYQMLDLNNRNARYILEEIVQNNIASMENAERLENLENWVKQSQINYGKVYKK